MEKACLTGRDVCVTGDTPACWPALAVWRDATRDSACHLFAYAGRCKTAPQPQRTPYIILGVAESGVVRPIVNTLLPLGRSGNSGVSRLL